jgi:hypothetical protein
MGIVGGVAAIVGKSPTGEAAKAGPWWFAVVLILCVVCYFLFKSMSKHMRKVREEFPVQDDERGSPHKAQGSDTEHVDLHKSDRGPDASS